MSLVEDGKRIVCDSPGCGAVSQLPVALRATLSASDRTNSVAEGWLFIHIRDGSLQFCPGCARAYLSRHNDDKWEGSVRSALLDR
jgi:hypothetical protein